MALRLESHNFGGRTSTSAVLSLVLPFRRADFHVRRPEAAHPFTPAVELGVHPHPAPAFRTQPINAFTAAITASTVHPRASIT
jgi:hypothetical protein